jgi:glutathione peroxidase-family protein
LVGKDGNVIASFAPTTSINDKEVTAALEAALK